MGLAFSQENPHVSPYEKGNLRSGNLRLEILTEFKKKLGTLVFVMPQIFT